MLYEDLEKFVKLVPFKGIPNALDYVPYSKAYYKVLEQYTYETYGKEATMLDATKVMNQFGNVAYFHWFPEMFKTEQNKLGPFYQPTFTLAARSEFTDYLHGLTHLRSRSEHTFLGEAMAVPDNLFSNGIGYGAFSVINADRSLEDCNLSLYETFELKNSMLPFRYLYRTDIIFETFFFQNEENKHYKIYREGHFKSDIPSTRVNLEFLFNPNNVFEERLAHNTIRAIFMDMKFREFSSLKKAFINTAPSDSSKESCSIIFTTDEEDQWIDKIDGILKSDSRKFELQTIINTTSERDSKAQKLAADTIKELFEVQLVK